MATSPVTMLSLATAVPPHVLEQSAVVNFARRIYADSFARYPKLADVFINAGIERRYSVRPIACLVAFLVVQRLAELGLAQWNTAKLRARGGVEFGAAHYPLLVALHTVWLLGLWMLGHDRSVEPLGLAAFVLLQGARVWVIASLGRRWPTRVIVVPGAASLIRGPYRWLRHPNYLIVVLEIAVVPLVLRLPLFALAFSLANAALLVCRIRIENQALAWATQTGQIEALTPATLANGYPRR